MFLIKVFFRLIISITIVTLVLSITTSSVKAVDVGVDVYGCVLELLLKPERRVSASTNSSLSIEVEIYDTDNVLKVVYQDIADNTGRASINLCDNNVSLVDNNYKFYVKGDGYLKRSFGPLRAFDKSTTTLDLRSDTELLAGEVSKIYDNYINSFDIDGVNEFFGSNTQKYDLNRDGLVNSMDISIALKNFNSKGDCSPRDVQNGICR